MQRLREAYRLVLGQMREARRVARQWYKRALKAEAQLAAVTQDRDEWEKACIKTASEVHGEDVTEIELRDQLAALETRLREQAEFDAAEKAELREQLAVALSDDSTVICPKCGSEIAPAKVGEE